MKSKQLDIGRKNFHVASDWFDLRFLCWFLPDDEAKPFKEHVNAKKIRTNPKDFSYRIINHWQEYGLIEDSRPDGKGWRKFSITDVIWLHILTELRKFGFSIENLKKVKSEMELYKDTVHGISEKPLLDFYIIQAMQSDSAVYLLVFQNGESLPCTKHELQVAQMIGTIESNYISINISELLCKVFVKPEKRPKYFDDFVLDKSETELIETVRNTDVQSVSVTLKDGAIVEMEGVIEEEANTSIADLLKMNKFQEITIKEHKGKVTKIERKFKTRPSQRDNTK